MTLKQFSLVQSHRSPLVPDLTSLSSDPVYDRQVLMANIDAVTPDHEHRLTCIHQAESVYRKKLQLSSPKLAIKRFECQLRLQRSNLRMTNRMSEIDKRREMKLKALYLEERFRARQGGLARQKGSFHQDKNTSMKQERNDFEANGPDLNNLRRSRSGEIPVAELLVHQELLNLKPRERKSFGYWNELSPPATAQTQSNGDKKLSNSHVVQKSRAFQTQQSSKPSEPQQRDSAKQPQTAAFHHMYSMLPRTKAHKAQPSRKVSKSKVAEPLKEAGREADAVVPQREKDSAVAPSKHGHATPTENSAAQPARVLYNSKAGWPKEGGKEASTMAREKTGSKDGAIVTHKEMSNSDSTRTSHRSNSGNKSDNNTTDAPQFTLVSHSKTSYPRNNPTHWSARASLTAYPRSKPLVNSQPASALSHTTQLFIPPSSYPVSRPSSQPNNRPSPIPSSTQHTAPSTQHTIPPSTHHTAPFTHHSQPSFTQHIAPFHTLPSTHHHAAPPSSTHHNNASRVQPSRHGNGGDLSRIPVPRKTTVQRPRHLNSSLV